MRFWVGVTAAFGAGAIIGAGVGQFLLKDKMQKEYEESSASMRRAFEAALIDARTSQMELDSDVVHIAHHEGLTNLEGGEVVVASPEATIHDFPEKVVEEGANPYWDSKKVAKPPEMISFAQLDEEDFYEADGRDKQQIEMIFVDGNAQFFMNGEEIENAFDLVGGTIVDDMRASVKDGSPVLWVRNNQTDTDYEVIFEQP